MAPRPRKNRATNVPNLYPRKHGDQVSYRYRDVRTNKFHTLGSDLQKAEHQAKQLNALIAQQMIEEQNKAILSNTGGIGITVHQWAAKYLKIMQEKVQDQEIKKTTYDQKRWALKSVLDQYGSKQLYQFSTLDINKLLKAFIKQGKATMAQRIRTVLIDLFAEAIQEGYYPADKPNPAAVTKMPKAKIKRARLTIEFFLKVVEWSKQNQEPYLWRSYIFALATGQRLDDVGNARFRDIRKHQGIEYFSFIQKKTGTKVMIPLDLKLEALGLTVGEIVNLCRDKIVSPYLFHHTKYKGLARPGRKVRTKRLSNGFAEAVRAVKPNWGDSNPPSFHENRSLSEREYAKQGVDTQKLLGHKHQITTDGYNDARGHDWVVVPLENNK